MSRRRAGETDRSVRARVSEDLDRLASGISRTSVR
jgi:hypothetical protein